MYLNYVTETNDLCFLESESGPCTQQEAAWYFDRNSFITMPELTPNTFLFQWTCVISGKNARCRCFNPCQNQDPQCPSNTRCAVDLVRNPETRETQYIAVCRPLYKEGECRPQPQNVCADNCKDDADCTGQAKCCPNDCGYSCSNLFDITTTTTTVSPAYPVYTSTPYTPNIPSPPRFHNYSEPTVEAEEGNFVTLRCIAIGYPIPVYTWSKGEVSIDGSDGHYKLTLDGVLQIVGLVRQDAGIYVCVAANGIGDPIRKEFNVIVRDPVGQRPAAVIGEDPTSESNGTTTRIGNSAVNSTMEAVRAITTGSIPGRNVRRCVARRIRAVSRPRDTLVAMTTDCLVEVHGMRLHVFP
ncbi:papilin-like [Diaphorina citri]|uniref:Papilin-like n=1 Tax=Diaphorina citri TaxID=121845 RepID=A0A3Q0ILY6_DIACI|nr:papilin-like [Diaphorina citri]